VALLLTLAGAGAAQARDSDPVTVGRYHLRKANQLAGEDHCHSAIHEYTLAYEKLKDPFVLFNRAECYRRIGQAEKAITDYRAFLEAVPAAPNRADIEAKLSALAALEQTPPPVAPASVSPPAAPKATESPRQPVAVLPPVEIQPPAAEPPPASPSPPAAVLPPAAPASSTTTESDQPRARHTWLWIAIAAAVVGGATGAYVALRAPATTPPSTDLGNYKF
jgi:tetratricopeptide (TPR) repeat protein